MKIDATYHNPNKVRASVTIIFLSLTILVLLGSVFSSLMQLSLITDLYNDVNITDELLDANDSREQLIANFELGLLLITSISFISWFRRAYYNLSFNATLEYEEGWAAGAWFVPILNWFRPYQIMTELWTKTAKFISSESAVIKKGSSIIGFWWAAWVVSAIFSSIVNFMTRTATHVDDFIAITQYQFGYLGLRITAAVLAIIVIKQYQELESSTH